MALHIQFHIKIGSCYASPSAGPSCSLLCLWGPSACVACLLELPGQCHSPPMTSMSSPGVHPCSCARLPGYTPLSISKNTFHLGGKLLLSTRLLQNPSPKWFFWLTHQQDIEITLRTLHGFRFQYLATLIGVLKKKKAFSLKSHHVTETTPLLSPHDVTKLSRIVES